MDDLFSYAARKARDKKADQAEPRGEVPKPSFENAPAHAAERSANSSPEPSAEPSAEPSPEPLTVSQVNRRAQRVLENSIGRIRVVGEVSGQKRVGGHCYFSLKDSRSQLSAVLFRRDAERLKFDLLDGREVIAHGRLSVYAPYGRYQLMVDRLEPVGVGALQAAFEALKDKLRAEGLFDSERKRALPRLPRRVAVVTSATGAVIRDVINVATRRYPRADILLIPSGVQGKEAGRSIVRGLRRASSLAEELQLDVVIVARGGGSLEDLWGYNLESVARAIAACSLPVVSAIGHESDFTIADFVADVRAPTPSAAAEIVFPEARVLRLALQRDVERTHRALKRMTDYERQRLSAARHRLGDAKGALREWSQSIEHVRSRIDASMRASITKRRAQLAASERALGAGHPRVRLVAAREAFARARKQAETAWVAGLTQRRHRLRELGVTLRALSPLAVLERGYAIALDAQGDALRRGSEVELGSTVKVRLHEGSITAQVVDRDGDDSAMS